MAVLFFGPSGCTAVEWHLLSLFVGAKLGGSGLVDCWFAVLCCAVLCFCLVD
jgi:hypothetical protein